MIFLRYIPLVMQNLRLVQKPLKIQLVIYYKYIIHGLFMCKRQNSVHTNTKAGRARD